MLSRRRERRRAFAVPSLLFLIGLVFLALSVVGRVAAGDYSYIHPIPLATSPSPSVSTSPDSSGDAPGSGYDETRLQPDFSGLATIGTTTLIMVPLTLLGLGISAAGLILGLITFHRGRR